MTYLELLRRGHGLTRAELSEKSGVPILTIIEWESGKARSVSSKTLLALASAIGCNVEDFFNYGES